MIGVEATTFGPMTGGRVDRMTTGTPEEMVWILSLSCSIGFAMFMLIHFFVLFLVDKDVWSDDWQGGDDWSDDWQGGDDLPWDDDFSSGGDDRYWQDGKIACVLLSVFSPNSFF